VALWAIEDDTTLEFMRLFYRHLVQGKKASEALNCASNFMRESTKFGKMCQWAPFVLIGDDVTLDCFEGDLDALKHTSTRYSKEILIKRVKYYKIEFLRRSFRHRRGCKVLM
jgi:hypothetical protein